MTDGAEERTQLARERTALASERNRLANERTYLAWVRTGLGAVGGGLAMIRFLTFQNQDHQAISQLVGCGFVVLGIVLFILAFLDYRSSCQRLKVENGYAGSIWTISAISLLLVVASLVLLFIAL